MPDFDVKHSQPVPTNVARRMGYSGFIVLFWVYFLVEYAKPIILEPFRPALLLQLGLIALLLLRSSAVLGVLQDRHFVLFGLLLAEMAIHVPTAANNFWAFYTFLPMTTYFLFSLSFSVLIRRPETFQLLVAGVIVIFSLCALDEVLAGGIYFGAIGYLADTNDFALMMNVLIPVSFYFGLGHRGFVRGIWWLTTILFVAANVSSASRGGFIGMLAVAVLCWLNSAHKIRAVLGMAAIIFAFLQFVPEHYKVEMLTIQEEGTETGTGKERVEYWKVAWKVFLDNPIVGVGQGNIPWAMEAYQDWTDYSGRGFGGRAVHSIYYTALAELGTIGSAIIVFMLLDLLRKSVSVARSSPTAKSFQKTDSEHSVQVTIKGLMIGLFGYLVSGIFLSALYYPGLWNISGLIVAGWRTLQYDVNREPVSSNPVTQWTGPNVAEQTRPLRLS